MKQNNVTSFDIVRNAVTDYQDKTGRNVYLSKFKFGYYTGALDFSSPDQFDRIMNQLDADLRATEEKTNA